MKSFFVSGAVLVFLGLIVSCGNANDISTNQNILSGATLSSYSLLSSDQIELQKALFANDVNECAKEKDQSQQEVCRKTFILTKAKENADVKVCEDLHDSEKEDCVYQAITALGEKEENTDVCLNVKEDLKSKCRDSIQYFLAERKGDSSLCEQISDVDVKSNCRFVLKKDVDCTKFSGQSDKDSCEFNHGQYNAVMELVRNKKKMDCSIILDMDLRQLCGQEMGLLNAVEKKDKNLCARLGTSFTYGEVKNKNYREDCMEKIK